MFQDEARFWRISDIRKCWCPRPVRPLCQSMITQEYTYAYSAISVKDGMMDSLILPCVNAKCMQIFLNEISSRYPKDRIIMIMDGAGWHKGIVEPPNIRIVIQPPYSPELNPTEHIWDEIREKYFHNHVFKSLDALEDHLASALCEMENDHQRVHSIVAWPWIINALMN